MKFSSTCKQSWNLAGFAFWQPDPQTHCKTHLSKLSNQNIGLEMSTYFPRVFSALEGHNKSTSFIIPQFQQMVWTIKSQFEPIKNVIYSISRQYRSGSTSLLICHHKEQINLHPSHTMTFCPEFWIFFFFSFAKLFLSSQFHSNDGIHSLFRHTNIYINIYTYFYLYKFYIYAYIYLYIYMYVYIFIC